MSKKFYAVAAMLLLIPLLSGGQSLKGSYFLDNSLNRNKLNPAFAPNTGYIQLPALGNFSASMLSNMSQDMFMYPMNGQLYSYLNSNVTFDKFEAALPKRPSLDITADLNLVNFGFFTGKGFWTVDVGFRENLDVDISRDVFLFLKKGMAAPGTYEMGSVSGNTLASFHASLGYARDMSDLLPGLRIGAKARAILPMMYGDFNYGNVSLSASPEQWLVNVEDRALYMAVRSGNATDPSDVMASFEEGWPGFSGFGFSVDLGAEYEFKFDGFINGIALSAAVLDLGMIRYAADAVHAYGGSDGRMDWTGMVLKLEKGETNEAWEELKGEFEELISFDEMAHEGSLVRSSMPGLNVGVEMPFCNNKMSLGALYSARKSYKYVRNELMLSYNLNPVKWFAASFNYSFLNLSKTFGWLLEFTPRVGPCFFVGSDYTSFEYAKMPVYLSDTQSVAVPMPMSWCLSMRFGVAFSLGGKNRG